MPPPDNISDILKGLRERTGLSMRDVASHLGVPHSTYQHYESARFKRRYLPLEMAEQLATLFASRGIDPADLYSLAGVEEAHQALQRQAREGRGMREDDAAPWDDAPASDRILRSLFPGQSSLAMWRIQGRALDLAGYMPGDYAVVDLNFQRAAAGDIVVAQRYNWQAFTAKTIIRLYDPPYLVTASTDPAFRRPDLVDNDRVAIKGVIVASVRLHSRLQLPDAD